MKDKNDRKTRDWEDDLAKEATSEKAREKAKSGGGGSKLSIQKRRFVFGGEVIGKELTAVVVDWVYLKAFYRSAYKEGEFSPPACYAISPDDDLSPHEKVSKPVSDVCEGCPNNEFGTAKVGRGKACSDKRRLALIAADDIEDVDNIEKADIAVLEIPPTALKGWSEYLEELKEKTQRPVYAVVTKISIDPDSDWPLPIFELAAKIKDKDVIDAIKERREEVREDLMRPYPEEDEVKGKKSKGKQKDDDDEDDDDEEDDEDDEDDKKASSKRKKAGKKASKDTDDDDDDEDDDNDDDEDEDDDRKKRGSRKGKKSRKDDEDDDTDDEDDEDEDDDKPRKRRKSAFGK